MPKFDYQADLASMVGSLVADRADAGPIHRLHTAVESTANYDFATHEFLFDPVRGYDFPLSDVGLAWLQANPYVSSVGHFRDMATHSDAQTTNRYVRSADHAIAKVIALRNEK